MHSRFKKSIGTALMVGAALTLLAMPALGAARSDFSAACLAPHEAISALRWLPSRTIPLRTTGQRRAVAQPSSTSAAPPTS